MDKTPFTLYQSFSEIEKVMLQKSYEVTWKKMLKNKKQPNATHIMISHFQNCILKIDYLSLIKLFDGLPVILLFEQ